MNDTGDFLNVKIENENFKISILSAGWIIRKFPAIIIIKTLFYFMRLSLSAQIIK
jgi:hypothetical protein